MKKIFARLLVILLIFCLLLTGCRNEPVQDNPQETQQETEQEIQQEIQQESTITPLLYRVTDQQGNVLWLFGSIHVGVDSYYPLPDYVLDAFDGSDALAVELDIIALEWKLMQQVQLLQMLMYTDGSTIKDHLPEQTYARAVEILQENGMYNATLDYYMPAFWWSAVESLSYEKMGAQASLGIDRHLLKRARNEDKTVLEVESAEFQYAIMAGFSPELQQLLLEGAIYSYENLDATAEDLKEMMDLWAEGDEAAFGAYLNQEEEFSSPEEEALYREYTDGLITVRNQTMTEYAVEALASGEEVFICVGAAHIVGEGAIAENLRQLGYQVEIVK